MESKTLQNVVVTVGLLAILAGLGLWVTRPSRPTPAVEQATPRQVELPNTPPGQVVPPANAEPK